MGSLTSRGRALVVVAFVVSAALCGTAAVALVVASRNDAVPVAGPTAQPTLPFPTGSPTASPTPSLTPVVTVSPTPVATKAASSPKATASTSPTPHATARVTSSPAGDWTGGATGGGTGGQPAPLVADASLDPADGDTTTATVFHLYSHATDGAGAISLLSLTWGDGASETPGTRGTACAAKAPADCRDFAWTHTYAQPKASGGYPITLKLQSGSEIVTLHLTAYVHGTA